MLDRSNRWPIGIVVALLCFVAGNIAVMRVASAPDALAHDEQYYRHAVNWDAEQAVAARGARLGWTVDVRATLVPDRDGRVVVQIADRNGQPVTGATVRVRGFHLAHANTVASASAPAVGSAYEATLALRAPGLWQLELEIWRQTDRLVLTRRLDVAAAATAAR
ncbi:MAG: FixH family protein [Gemmatimonadaceae bacterium]|nr:FixH family protein [Gemmatimonadaceae bacterium]